MDDITARALLVVAVAAVAVVAGRLVNRFQQPTHPPVHIDGLGLPPGVIAFTSTHCDNCRRVMAMVGTLDVPVREVTNDLEANMVSAAGVEAVPLLVVTDRDGAVVRQLAGTPSKAAVRRAVRKAGW